MISKGAIRKFLNRDLDDWSCVKDLTELEVWEELDEALPEKFVFKTEPWKHQAASFICGLYNTDFIFHLEMGAGKSLIVAQIMSYYRQKGDYSGKTLILAPNEASIAGWEEQIESHSDFTYTSLIGKALVKWNIFEESETDFYIISYDGLIAMLTSLVINKKKKKKERKPVDKLVKKFAKSFQGLILDEIHMCKNSQTVSYKLCNKIAAQCAFRYGLTGTPFGRDPIDLWAQFYLIDRGETLSTTLGMYREVFFKKETNHFGSKWVFDTTMWEELHRVMRHRSIRYSEEELDSMPPKVYSTVKVSFPSENYQYYEKAVAGLIEARGNYQMLDNAFMRLRQIVSGYIDFKDEDGNRERIVFRENYRLDALLDDIENTAAKAKIVIFVEFTPSGDMIAERLKKKKIKFERLYGGTKDKIAVIDNFKKDPAVKILLANSKSGGVSLNLQCADYEFFYESPVSPIVRAQAEKRVPRGDKRDTTYIRDYVVKNSVDEKIMGFLKEGKDLFAALIDGEAIIE